MDWICAVLLGVSSLIESLCLLHTLLLEHSCFLLLHRGGDQALMPKHNNMHQQQLFARIPRVSLVQVDLGSAVS